MEQLNTKDFGTSKRPKVAQSKPKAKPNLKADAQRFVNWIDNNVLPFVALVVLAGLAVKGTMIFLPEMSETTQTVVAIAGVALLVVKLKASK
jgi:hypothetical protein